LEKKIFPKYPKIYREIKDDSKYRYNSSIKDEMMKHKGNHIEVVNKRSSYNIIYLKEKPALLKCSAENARINTKQKKKNTDLELKNF
jgi:hypothetical protein